MDVSVEKQFKEKKSRIFLCSGVLLFLIVLISTFGYINIGKAATSPNIITYQGKLLSGGVAVTTTQDITYVLYNDPTGGTALYSAAGTTSSPSAVSTTVSDGFFTIDLGDTGTNSIDPSIFKNNSAVYLKVMVGSEALSPRKRITASPFAINSKYLDGVGSSSTPQSSTYIPVSDASGNFAFNNITSTGLSASSANFVNATSSGSFWTSLLNATTGWITNLFWTDATSTGSTHLNTLAVTGNSYFGTVASGTWQGNIVSNAFGGTGQDTSGWTGFAKITGGVWSTSTMGINDLANSSTLAYLNNNQTFTGANTFSSTTVFASTSFNGYVGIGTSTPSEKLQVNGGNILHNAFGNPTIKSSLGVSSQDVYVSGKYAYVAGGNFGLQIIDISNSETPSVVGTIDTPGCGTSVFVSGKYAYLGDCGSGLQIIDVSNPGNPTIVGNINVGGGQMNSVYVSGKFAYVTNIVGLQILDVSNPVLPVLVSTFDAPNISGVYVSGRYAYFGGQTPGKFYTVDISSPNSPSLMSEISTTGTSKVYVSGKYAYLADTTGGLKVVDISNPSSPVVTGALATALASDVFVSGKYAYVADANTGVKVVDISNPSNLSLVGSVSSYNPRGIYVSGKYAYLADDTTFKIIDINGIDTPSLNAGNIATNDLTVWENMDVGNNLYVRNGLNIGSGGLLSNGALAITVSSTISTSTIFSAGTISTSSILAVNADGTVTIKALTVSGNTSLATTTISSSTIGYLSVVGNSYFNTIASGTWNGSLIGNNYGGTGVDSSGWTGFSRVDGGVWSATSSISLNADISGVLAVANGGTGTSTFSNGGVVFSDGTQLLQDNSNFFWDNTNNRLGLGTSTPASRLQVYGGTLLVDNPVNPSLVGITSTTDIPGTSIVKVIGNYAYVPTDGAFMIFDISKKTTPVLIGSVTSTYFTSSFDMKISGKYAYVIGQVAIYSAYLSVVDISNPYSPVVVSSLFDANFGRSIDISGKYAYIGNIDGASTASINVVDISNPSEMHVANIVTAPTYALSVANHLTVSGRYLYVAAYQDSKFTILDIINPSQPVLMGTVNVPIASITSNIYISGKYAFFINNSSGSYLGIVDVSNPSAPVFVSDGGVYSDFNNGTSIEVSGKYAYLVGGQGYTNGGIGVYDISDVANPVFKKGFGSGSWGRLASIDVVGKYAYIVGNSYSSGSNLSIVDLNGADISAANIGNVFSNELTVSENIEVGNNISIRNGLSVGIGGILSNGTVAISVSNLNSTSSIFSVGTSTPSMLTVMGNGYIGIGTSTPSEKLQINGGNVLHTAYGDPILKSSISVTNAAGVYISGKYAYLADFSGGFKILDITNPSSSTLVGVVTTSISSAREVFVSGKYAYVANQSNIKIVDISNPTLPNIVGSFTTGAYGIYVSGKYAYVSASNEGLKILDVSNPTAPVLSGFVTSTNAVSSYVSGKYAYLADYGVGLKIVDISNPASPQTVSTFVTTGSTYDVYVSGKYAFIADNNKGLEIVDISNPLAPVLAGTYDTTGFAQKIYVSGKYAYIAGDASGLQVLDVSNPALPSLVGTLNTGGSPFTMQDIFVAGKYAYFADGTSFRVVDINGLETPTISTGNIATNDLTVSENIDVGNSLSIRNGLNVGMGGIFANGAVAITVSTTIGTSTIFSVGTSTASFLTVMGDGKIGIGTSTPSTTLGVVGDVGITSGALYINNSNYSQYFVGSAGTAGQLWQSNGTTGTWANTNGVFGQTMTYGLYGWEKTSAIKTTSTVYTFEGSDGLPSSFVASGPNTNWTVTSGPFYSGFKSLQSATTTDNSSSTITNIVYLPTTTTISFWWKVSSEGSRDYFVFCIDRPNCYATNAASSSDRNISGFQSWAQVTSTLSAGTHTLKWIYMKDVNTASGADAGFLDDVFIGKNDGVYVNETLSVGSQVVIGTSTYGPLGYKLTIDSGSSAGAGIGVNGYIKATGFITGTTTLDLAENYPINMLCEINNNCPVEGDIVCSDSTVVSGVKKCSVSENSHLIGIVSTNPGFLLGGGSFDNPTQNVGTVKVALAGRVPVKVSTINGEIVSGDKLTLSNIDGVAAKAVGEVPVVGIAMEGYSGSGEGSIIAFVNLGWQNQLYKALTIDTNTTTLTVGSNVTPYNLALSGEFTMFNDVLNKLVFNATAIFESKTNSTHAFVFNAVNFGTSTDKYLLSLRSNDDPRFSVMSNGDVRASGNLYAASAVFGTSSNPGDLAERVDIASDDIVEPGDVLVVDMNNPDTYRRSSGSNEQAVAGVVSTNPTIVVGNGKTEYTSVMAMVGRVPLKVSDENGPISRGDLLVTASSTGYAMKYDPKKDNDDKMIGVVGVALDPFNGGKGKIMALVRTGWVNSRYETISSIKENIQQLATAQGITLGATSTNNLNIEKNSSGQLFYVRGDLNLQGNNLINVNSIIGKNNRWSIDGSGHFITKVNTSEGEKDMFSIQSPTSEFVFSSSSQLMGGEVKVVFDQTMQDVIDVGQPLKINITLTSGEAKGIFVSEKNAQGFTVKELNSGTSNATFDWMVVAKRKEEITNLNIIENLSNNIIENIVTPTNTPSPEPSPTSSPSSSQEIITLSTPVVVVPPVQANPAQEPPAPTNNPVVEPVSVTPPTPELAPAQ